MATSQRQDMRILLVEDDERTAGFIARSLREHGHTIDVTGDGREGLMLAAGQPYDAMIIDRMLPGLEGLAIVKTIRAAGSQTPVIMLTTKSQIGDRVEGLEGGADDYLVKPFAFAELNARLNALVRRPPMSTVETVLRVHDLEMDLLKRTVTRAGTLIAIQPQEFKLLEFLMRRAGRVVTRTMLLEGVWDFHFDPMTKVVETHISRLRGKVDKGFDAELIHTIRGAGYVLRAPE
jgi:two-component system, OmpR family, response regulator